MGVAAFAAPALVGVASLAVSLCLALPAAQPGRPATVLLLPGQQGSVLAALITRDPELRLLDVRAGGALLAVVYARPDLPERLGGTGAIAVIGAGRIGCQN